MLPPRLCFMQKPLRFLPVPPNQSLLCPLPHLEFAESQEPPAPEREKSAPGPRTPDSQKNPKNIVPALQTTFVKFSSTLPGVLPVNNSGDLW